jgi:hypothetical protein
LPQRRKIVYRALFATSVQHNPATYARHYHNALIRIVTLHSLAIPVRPRGLTCRGVP